MFSRFLPMLAGLVTLAVGWTSFDGQSARAQEAADNQTQRFSAFYFPGELGDAIDQPLLTTLHASAIQAGADVATIWINGTELGVNDRIGPVRITAITPMSAALEVTQDTGRVQFLDLSINQTLTLKSHQGVTEVVGVREGVGAMLAQTLRRTRLP